MMMYITGQRLASKPVLQRRNRMPL